MVTEHKDDPVARAEQRVHITINASVLQLAKRAYATTWHEEETDAWIRWVTVAVQRHLGRTPQERAEAVMWLPAVADGPMARYALRLDRGLVAALDAAISLDVEQRGVKRKRSPWVVEAMRVATLHTDRAWHGLDELDCVKLPWPPSRSGLLV